MSFSFFFKICGDNNPIHLESLDLSAVYEYITDEILQGITRRLPDLQELNLLGCYKVSDAGLAHLSGLPKLQKLNLRGCENITDETLIVFSINHPKLMITIPNWRRITPGIANAAKELHRQRVRGEVGMAQE